MGTLQSKRFDEPDELITLPLLTSQVVVLGEVYLARSTHEPGWRWSEHVRPVVGRRAASTITWASSSPVRWRS